VKIEFLSSKGQAKKITLRRMKVEAIADKHQVQTLKGCCFLR